VLTSPATGKSLTSFAKVTDKDLRVTDNGDVHPDDPHPLNRQRRALRSVRQGDRQEPGQIRFKILVDDGGTPNDPSDDEILADLGVVKGSTGRSDDFCDTAVPALSCAAPTGLMWIHRPSWAARARAGRPVRTVMSIRA